MPKVTDKGLYRPTNCMKYCVYNRGEYGCCYKKNTKLPDPIKSWHKCQYFKHLEDAQRKKEREDYDLIYGRMATYVDSHSAVWKV